MKVNFIIMLMNNRKYKITVLVLLLTYVIACNSKNKNGSILINKTTNQKDTMIFKNKEYNNPVNKGIKTDTLKKGNNEIISIDGNRVITKKGKKQVLLKKTYHYGTNNTITLIKLDNDDNFFSDCNDPICVLLVINKNNKSIGNQIKIPVVYVEDFNFLFKNKHYYFFEYYSSSVGFSEYYIFDTINNFFYKTDEIEEGAKVIRNSFNFNDKTFRVKLSGGKEITKNFSLYK